MTNVNLWFSQARPQLVNSIWVFLCVCFECNVLLLSSCLFVLRTGVLGLIGCFVFVAKADSSSFESLDAIYSWAFYFTIIGSVLVFVASIVILFGGKTARKSWRMPHQEGNVSPEPVRRFSQLWARESPSTPVGARRQLGPAMSHDFATLPPLKNPPPTTMAMSSVAE